MEYRFNFIVTLTTIFIWQMSVLFTFSVIYYSVDNIGGWSFEEMSFLLGTNALIETTFMSFIFLNLFELPNIINNCDLDFLLLKPINTVFLVSFKRVDFGMLIGGLPSFIIYMIYSFPRIKDYLNLSSIIIYLILIINGLVIMFSIFFIIKCLSFYFIKADGLCSLAWAIYDFARKAPGTVYPTLMRAVLTYVVPVLVIVFFPAGYGLKKFTINEIVIPCSISVVLLTFSIIFWKTSLRRYNSASS